MSGSHLSKEFFELIKAIGECRSKQEEDRLMTTEAVLLRQRVGELPQKRPRELIVRMLYLELLGNEGGGTLLIHAVTLANSKNLLDKRAGYLACSLLLKPDHELMLLLINTLLKDLQSANFLEVSAALITATRLMNADMVPILQPKISALLSHAQEAVRRQALMAWLRCVELGSAAVTGTPEYQKVLRKALSDSDPSVMHAGLCMLEALDDEQLRSTSRDLVTVLVGVLKSVQGHKLPKDFEYHRFPAPWTQTLLLKLIGRLVQGDAGLSAQCYECLAETLRKAEAGVNVGQAVIYQCIETISLMHPDRTLLELALHYIHKFLASNSHNNLRHAGVKLLGLLVGIDATLALDLQVAVVECLEDADDTLRTETVDLLVNMANVNNCTIILDKLLIFLRTAPPDDSHLKLDLINKIFQLNEQYSSSASKFAEILITLLKLAGSVFPTRLFARIVTVLDEEAAIREVLLLRLEKEAQESQEPVLVALALAVLANHSDGRAIPSELFSNAEKLARTDSCVARYLFELKLKLQGLCVLEEYALSANTELRTRSHELKTLGRSMHLLDLVDIDEVAAVLDEWAFSQPVRVSPSAQFLEGDYKPSQRLRFEAYERPQIPPVHAPATLPAPASFASSPASAASAANTPPAVHVAKRWGPQGFKAAPAQPVAQPSSGPHPPAVYYEEPRQISSSSSVSVASRTLWQPRKTRAEIEEEERRKAEEEDKCLKARQLFLGEKTTTAPQGLPLISGRWQDEEESPVSKPKRVLQRLAVEPPKLDDHSKQPGSTATVVDLLDITGSPKQQDERELAPKSPHDLLDDILGPMEPTYAEVKFEPLLPLDKDLRSNRSAEVGERQQSFHLAPLALDVDTVGSLWGSLPAEASGEVKVPALDTFEDVLRAFAEQVGLHRVDLINEEAILAGQIDDSKVFVHAAWKVNTVAVLVVSSSSSLSQQVLERLERL